LPTQAVVSVPALCAFTHEGRSYVQGEIVDVPPVVALILARQKKVSLGRPPFARTVGRYRRRDMRAER
jgi:hypothetical protein